MIRLPSRIIISFFLIALGWQATTSAEEAEDPNFNLQLTALTNKVRDYNLRVKAMNELVVLDSNRAFPVLASILKDSTDNQPIRYLAAQKLVQINHTLAINSLQKILDNQKEDTFARRTAMAQLIAASESDMRHRILDILNDPTEDPAMRQYALGIFSQWEDPRKVAKLRNFVVSKTETLSMRTNALFTLESIKDLDFVSHSIHQFLNDKNEDEDLRKNCVIIAQRINDDGSVPIMAIIAKDKHEPSSLRQLAIMTLARVGNGAVLEDLEAIFKQEFDETISRELKDTISSIKQREKNRNT